MWMTGDEGLFSTIFTAILLCCFLMDNGYNIETCKIIGSTSLRLHFLPCARFFRSSKGGWPSGKYATDDGDDDVLLDSQHIADHFWEKVRVESPWKQPSRASLTSVLAETEGCSCHVWPSSLRSTYTSRSPLCSDAWCGTSISTGLQRHSFNLSFFTNKIICTSG